MGKKYIANEDMQLVVKAPEQGKITIISQPSTSVKISEKGVYRGPLQFMVSNITSPGHNLVNPGTLPMGVIQPTAQDTKADNMLVIRVGDKASGLTSVGAMEIIGNSTVPCMITFSVEVTDAGQSVVQGS